MSSMVSPALSTQTTTIGDNRFVWILYILYPCPEWKENPHGATVDCECEEYQEGVYSSFHAANNYIATWLDREHNKLNWNIETDPALESVTYRSHSHPPSKRDFLYVIDREKIHDS